MVDRVLRNLLPGAGIVALYAVGVRLRPDIGAPRRALDASDPSGDTGVTGAGAARWAAASLCFAVCTAAVAYRVCTPL